MLCLVVSACTSGDPVGDATTVTVVDRGSFEIQFIVSSPDGELRAELGTDELGRARYRVVRFVDGARHVVVGASTLGLESSLGSFALAPELRAVTPAAEVRDSFSLPHGKAREASVQAVTQSFVTGNVVANSELTITFWVSDRGVAFRYRLDSQDGPFAVEWERTSFAMPAENRAWLQAHDAPSVATPAYEALRRRESTAANPGRAPFGWTFPALFADDVSYTLITETSLADGAAGSHFSPAVTNGEFLLDFANRGEGNGIGDPRPTAERTWISPWRLIMNSPDLSGIVESDLVRHLSEPSLSPAPSWVEPGRVSWSWWSDHSSSRNADAMEPFIDLAAEMGWEFSLIDANWDSFGNDRLVELIDYAARQNVELFLWYNSGGPNNAVTEGPRDLMSTSSTRRAEFERIAALGIRGVKVDFFQSDKPVTIQLYRDILSDATDFELMVNFHGSTLPRGWQREFPNLMTMEAVRGAEIYTFDPGYHRAAARQNTVLAFTRNVVGPMDYTPIILGDEVRRITTNGHELGLAVVFESALLHMVDTPDAYLSQPAEVQDLLSSVPTVWDQTRLVAGLPESHVAIARRSGDDWWIGAISALEEPETVAVDLQALGVTASATITQVCDDPTWQGDDALDPERYLIQVEPALDRLSLPLAPLGGCLVRIAS